MSEKVLGFKKEVFLKELKEEREVLDLTEEEQKGNDNAFGEVQDWIKIETKRIFVPVVSVSSLEKWCKENFIAEGYSFVWIQDLLSWASKEAKGDKK